MERKIQIIEMNLTWVIFCVLISYSFHKCFRIHTNKMKLYNPNQFLSMTLDNNKLNRDSITYEEVDNSLKMNTILFVESGFGCDQHGQNSTKAALRACRNAIEFNSIPSIRNIIPGGKENMLLRVQIGVPSPETVDVNAIQTVFPYGKLLPPEVIEGGIRASSGIALPEMGDKNDDMIIAVAVITIGY